jgi:hypothetical protein
LWVVWDEKTVFQQPRLFSTVCFHNAFSFFAAVKGYNRHPRLGNTWSLPARGGVVVTAGTKFYGRARLATTLPGRHYDHLFFSGLALLSLVTVFFGFARTYYLAGLFRAPLDGLIVHVHGAAFSCWILLLVIQTSLVASGRVDVHRRLGVAGFFLACLLVVLGVLVNNHALVIQPGPPGADMAFIYLLGLALILIFAVLTYFAFRFRSNPPVHKRLIIMATTALLVAAIVRLPLAIIHSAERATWLSYSFLLMLLFYDLWSTRKLHRATLAAGSFLVLIEQLVCAVGHGTQSQAFARWMYSVLL